MDRLEEIDVLFLGDPQIEKRGKGTFHKEELIALKKFVAQGNGLFLTSSAGGDHGLKRSAGSLRVLYKITGVIQFWNGVVRDPKHSVITKQNIVVKNIDNHPVTEGIEELVFGNSTFLELTEDADPLVFTEDTTEFKYIADEEIAEIGVVPLLAVTEFYRGRCVTAGASNFFLEEDEYMGVDVKGNRKLIRNAFNWLAFYE